MSNYSLELGKAPLNHQKSQSQTEAIGSRAFSSIQTTLFQDIFFMKVLVLYVNFHSNLIHSIWTFVDKVISKTRKLLKIEKLQLLAVATNEASAES